MVNIKRINVCTRNLFTQSNQTKINAIHFMYLIEHFVRALCYELQVIKHRILRET